MKWNADKPIKFGTTRDVIKFALLPVLLDDGVIVWLENYKIRQIFGDFLVPRYHGSFHIGFKKEVNWKTIKTNTVDFDWEKEAEERVKEINARGGFTFEQLKDLDADGIKELIMKTKANK